MSYGGLRQQNDTVSINSVEGLLRRGIVYNGTKPDEIDQRVKGLGGSGRTVKLLYGETFDGTNTVDSLRYYFTVSALAKIMQQTYGPNIESIVLIADENERINRANDPQKIRKEADDRKRFVETVQQRYGGSFKAVLQSETKLGSEEAFDRYRRDEGLMSAVRGTVPAGRLIDEEKNGFRYTMMELIEIMEGRVNIKVGPPREKLYDDIAVSFAPKFGIQPLLPVYLPPTYPLGLKFNDYMSDPNTLTYGIIPYRSEVYPENRIKIGITTEDRVRTLIETTDVSKKEKRPNPLLSLAITAELARQHLAGRFEAVDLYERFYDPKSREGVGITELRGLTFQSLKENVLDVLRD